MKDIARREANDRQIDGEWTHHRVYSSAASLALRFDLLSAFVGVKVTTVLYLWVEMGDECVGKPDTSTIRRRRGLTL